MNLCQNFWLVVKTKALLIIFILIKPLSEPKDSLGDSELNDKY